MRVPDLRSLDVFSHFPAPQLDRLPACVRPLELPHDQPIFAQGDAPGDAFLLLDGRVAVVRETAYGPIRLGVIRSGELFGEVALVDGGPRSTTARTVSASRLLVLDAEALAGAARDDPRFDLAVHWTFWNSLSAKLRTGIDHLTLFFPSEDGETVEPAPPVADADDVRVGLDTKRSLFQDQVLSRLEINFLASLSQEKRFAPGATIFRDGEDGNAMYVVLDGQVRISKQLAGAGEEALAVLERGDFFGEMALIDDRPRTADARAHQDGAVVLAIPSDVVSGLLDIERFSSVRLLRLLCRLAAKRLRELDEKLAGWHIMAGQGHRPSLDTEG